MNDPQVWTVLGLFSAIMIGTFGLVIRIVLSSINARFDATDAKLDARFDAVDARFVAVDWRIDTMERRLDEKIDHLGVLLGGRLDLVEHRLGVLEGGVRRRAR